MAVRNRTVFSPMVWNIFVPEREIEMNFLDFMVLIVGNEEKQDFQLGSCAVWAIVILCIVFALVLK